MKENHIESNNSISNSNEILTVENLNSNKTNNDKNFFEIINHDPLNINKHTDGYFQDFCPGVSKNIDCNAAGGLIQLTDAFYGISNSTPAICVYKLVFDTFL